MIYRIQYSLLKKTVYVFSAVELELTKACIAEIDGEKRYCKVIERMLEDTVSSTELGTNHIVKQVDVADEIHHDLHSRRCLHFLSEANKIVKELDLQCRFIAAEPLFDLRRIQFYFKAHQPVHFRLLAKRLRELVKTQIDLQQVEGREVTKLTSDVGMCGEQTCCTRFLYETPIINEEDVKKIWSNNWQSVGVCNRIKCCATFEKNQTSDTCEKGCGDSCSSNTCNKE